MDLFRSMDINLVVVGYDLSTKDKFRFDEICLACKEGKVIDEPSIKHIKEFFS